MKKSGIFFVFFLALCISGALADSLAVPGQRLDGAFMDMDYYLIQKGWGPADEKVNLTDDLVLYKHKRYNTWFYVKQDKLAMVETFSSSFKTESGLKVGSHRQDVVNALGSPIDEENFSYICPDGKQRSLYCQIYAGDGIAFSYEPETHQVYSILVFISGNYIRGVHQ